MSTILVVDDMPAFREPIAACLQANGYRVQSASNGKEALEIVRVKLPDLVLLDVGMPVMDGLAFLEAIGADPKTRELPVILLTAIAEKASILRAAKLGVRDYLLKSRFSLKELLSRIAARLDIVRRNDRNSANPVQVQTERREAVAGVRPKVAARATGAITTTPSAPMADGAGLASLQRIIMPDELQRRLHACDEIGALSPAIDNVVKLTGHSACSVHQLGSAIKQDQGLALKVLKLANSVAYRRGMPVSSIDLAVQRIGVAQIRQMVLSIGVIDRLSASMRSVRLDARKFWEHSIGCGLIAAEITRCRGGSTEDVDTAFTMSLLHDTGRAVLAEQLGEVYENVLGTAERLKVPVEQAESRMLGVNHAEVMQDLLQRWKFGQHLAVPIAKHHLSIGRMREATDQTAPAFAVLALADRLAHAMVIGSSGNDTIYPVHELIEWLKLDTKTIQSIGATIHDQTADLKFVMLSRSSDTDWPDTRREFSSGLGTRTRPLFVGENPQIDPYRMFFSTIADGSSDEPPNLLVVHLSNPKSRGKIDEMVIAAEKTSRVPRLPMMIISPDGSACLDERIMAGRQHEGVKSPARATRLTEAANRLLAPQDASASAAPAPLPGKHTVAEA